MATHYYKSDQKATATLVNDEPCELNFVEAANKDTGDRWLQIFDAAAAGDVTVGTTTPDLSLFIPKGDGTLYGAMDKVFASPIKMVNGIVIAATTTPTGSSAPTADVNVNMAYT